MSRIAIVGAGAWGTALATLYAGTGHAVTLLARDPVQVEAINRTHRNERYLPEVALSPQLRATGDAAEALRAADAVLLVVPAQTLADVAATLQPHWPAAAPAVICSKGIEQASGRFASEVLAAALPDAPVAVLSGPSFADDVARGLPTAVTLACGEAALADDLAQRLSAETFRCYSTTDLRGVEAGGALKNVLAIAAGAVAGRGLGASALAAVVTRGFVELRRLGEAFGAKPETLMGLSGLGDLVLTCSGEKSRNFAYGLALGRGEGRDGLKLAEGVYTAAVAARLAAERGIEAPIIGAVAAILEDRLSVDDAVRQLLARPLKREVE
ncbi:NAD(P)H-dependent glycerol-3-phosphate dehydrogenase [Mangrovicella endophytica]|uniref:NAD(P)H-dependent glycerol-3-phosphate dehydrogenase n=1 Tax=Mangrovicella endophytica TaxID=2066697 RepID=UPI000C9E1868|nr:NAD(P)H-dependent glycerol-3-phosphate dehydrogenase [Mangrovicella endophytica]